MGDDGKLTADFSPSMLGDEYADSKFFETTPDIVSLMKAGADSKSALGKKLENIIQIPGEEATDEQKVAYKAELRKASGAPESAEILQFTPPEGRKYDEELIKVFKEKFFEHGISQEVAGDLVATLDTFQMAIEEQTQNQADQAFKTEVEEYTKAHLGDKLVTGPRTAAKAIIEFADDGLRAKVQDAKLIENPGNFKAWREIGITPKQLAIWENVGSKMKSDQAISDEGELAGGKETEEQVKIAAQYPHPTSVADRKARGVAV